MTKEEIQALINAKIAGQGSAVDVGGALPAILSEILNIASSKKVDVIEILSFSQDTQGESEEAALARLKVNGEPATKEKMFSLRNSMPSVVIKVEDSTIAPVSCLTQGDNSLKLVGGMVNYLTDVQVLYEIYISGGNSHVIESSN